MASWLTGTVGARSPLRRLARSMILHACYAPLASLASRSG